MTVVQRIGQAIGQIRSWSIRHVLLVVGWLLALTIIEINGQSSGGDLADALALMELFFVFIVSLALDYESTTGAIKGLFRWIQEKGTVLFSKRLLLGLDLRAEPAISASVPRRWLISLALLVVLNSAALVASAHLPILPRDWFHGRFYLAYLLLLVSLWAVIATSIVLTGFVAWGGVHDYFVTRYQGSGVRDRRTESFCLRGGIMVILFGIVMLPAWTPLALLAVLMVLWTIPFLCYRDRFQLLWKRRDAEEVHAVDGCFAIWLSCVAPVLLVAFLILLSRGSTLHDFGPIPAAFVVMPITSGLGIVLSWTVTAAMIVKVASSLRLFWMRRGLCLSRKVFPVLHVEGKLNRKEKRLLRAEACTAGWHLRFAPRAARPTDVKVRFCRHLDEQDSDWPLPITLKSFSSSDTQYRLTRRDEIQSRRLVLHGLERIFKRAARLSDRSGTGFLIGVQHWFMLGLLRDKEPDFTQDREATVVDMIVGPPYHMVIPLHARRHFRKILDALAIDVIFVEDGVSYRKLVRAMRVAFEIYDIHGGQRRAEERDFHGLPGLRVMLHEISMVETTTQVERGYPEPDYEDFGRARILHIFKDRSEHEEWEPLPWATDDVPLLSGH
jgi:hypothetical protein